MAESAAQGAAFYGNINRHLLRVLAAYRNGWKQAARLPRLAIMVYFLQLLFALLITLPLKKVLSVSFGSQSFLDRPAAGFDFILFSDFLNQQGNLLRASLGQSVLLTLLFLVFYVFLTGGIVQTLISGGAAYSARTFFEGAGRFFGKLLGSFVLFGLIQGLMLLLFIGVVILQGVNPFTMASDLHAVRWIQWMIPVFLIPLIVASMVHDHVKVGFIQHPESSFIQVLRMRSAQAVRRLLPSLGLYIAVAGTGLLIYLAGKVIGRLFTEHTLPGLWSGFLVSQVFILARVVVKFVNYASIYAFYTSPEGQTDLS